MRLWIKTLPVLFVASATLSAAAIAYTQLDSGQFGIMNLDTGSFKLIGTAPFGGANGVAIGPNGKLFVGDSATGNLYTVDPTTGSFTLVGNSGITPLDIAGLNGSLYEQNINLDMYRIDPNTAAATLVGPTVTANPFPNTGSLTAGNGVLYLTVQKDGMPDRLLTMDPTTGAVMSLGDITGEPGLNGSGFI